MTRGWSLMRSRATRRLSGRASALVGPVPAVLGIVAATALGGVVLVAPAGAQSPPTTIPATPGIATPTVADAISKMGVVTGPLDQTSLGWVAAQDVVVTSDEMANDVGMS